MTQQDETRAAYRAAVATAVELSRGLELRPATTPSDDRPAQLAAAEAEVRRLDTEDFRAYVAAANAAVGLDVDLPAPTPEPVRPVAYVQPPTDLQMALATNKVVTKAHLDHAVANAVAEVEQVAASRLQNLTELADAARVTEVVTILRTLHRSRTATHDANCWQRHTGCLARRLLAVLGGERVDR